MITSKSYALSALYFNSKLTLLLTHKCCMQTKKKMISLRKNCKMALPSIGHQFSDLKLQDRVVRPNTNPPSFTSGLRTGIDRTVTRQGGSLIDWQMTEISGILWLRPYMHRHTKRTK